MNEEKVTIKTSEEIIDEFLNNELKQDEQFRFIRAIFNDANSDDYIWSPTDFDKKFQEIILKPDDQIKKIDNIISEVKDVTIPDNVRIKSFCISGFKGCLEPFQISLDGKNYFVRGENTSGKTTIADALYFFLNRNISWAEGGGTGDFYLKDIRHIKLDPQKDASVEVDFMSDGGCFSDTITLTELSRTSYLKNNQFVRELQREQGRIYIRHGLLLNFMNKGDKDKWDEIVSLLGFEKINRIYKLLNDIRTKLDEKIRGVSNDLIYAEENLNTQFSSMRTQLENIENELGISLEPLKERIGQKEIIKRINDIISIIGKKLKLKEEDITLNQIIKILKEKSQATKIDENKLKTLEILNKITIPKVKETISQIKQFKAKVIEWQNNKEQIKELLLHETYRYLYQALNSTEALVEECPVCGNKIFPDKQPINKNILLQRLEIKQKESEALNKQFKNDLNSLIEKINPKIQKAKLFLETINNNSESLEDILQNAFPSSEKSFQDKLAELLNNPWFSINITRFTEMSFLTKADNIDNFINFWKNVSSFIEKITPIITKSHKNLSAWFKKIEKEKKNKKVDEFFKWYEQCIELRSIKNNIDNLIKNKKIQEIESKKKNKTLLKQRLGILDGAISKFIELRSKYIQLAFNKISTLIDDYFHAIHPYDKKISDIKFSTDGGKASLVCKYSGKTDISPLKVLSEGQLYSLGLCIFLASAKILQTKINFLIFDDVVQSSDINRREDLLKLLSEEFNDKQIIFFTHDENTHERAATFWHNHNTLYQQFSPSDSHGLVPKKDSPEISLFSLEDRLIGYTINSDKGAIIGRWLEFKLKRILKLLNGSGCNVYVKVPFNDLKLTLSPLMDALIKFVKENCQDKILSNIIKKPEYKELLRLDRNKVHGDESFSDEEIKAFQEYANKLVSIFICQECGEFVRDLSGVCFKKHINDDGNIIPVQLYPKRLHCKKCGAVCYDFINARHLDDECDGNFEIEIFSE